VTFSPAVALDPAFILKDLIVWDNHADESEGPVFPTYSDVGGGGVPGVGNISADPSFAIGLRGRFYLTQNDPNQPSSPALDAGSASAAATGNSMLTTSVDGAPDAGTVDMGAHFAPAPADSPDPVEVLRLDPSSGDFEGHDWVLVRGTGFDPGARVNFGTPEATNTIYINSQRLLVQPPPRGLITVGITVTNPDDTSFTLPNAYHYIDNMPPDWLTTTGAQAAASPLDCVRSVIVDWNAATDVVSPPVRYEVHRFLCDPAPIGASPPCLNYLDFIPTAATRVANTAEMTYIDTNFSASGADPKYLYIVRALDSADTPNKELNLSKRLGTASRNISDTTPPAPVGNTLEVSGSILLDWASARGAVKYRVHRQTNPAAYATPASLVPLITLDNVNNDQDADGFVDTRYTDGTVPAVGQIFFYKISALDPCNVETLTADLAP